MANQAIQEGKLCIIAFGGINELSDDATSDPSEIASVQNLMPELAGMVMRMFGKLLIGKKTGQIKAIHQFFTPFGFYGQFLQYDDRVEMGFCRDNLSFASYYNRLTNLGVDSSGTTLNTFGLDGQAGSMVLALTKLTPNVPCMLPEPTAPPPTSSYTLDTPGIPSQSSVAPDYQAFLGLRIIIGSTPYDYFYTSQFNFGDQIDFTSHVTADANIQLLMIYQDSTCTPTTYAIHVLIGEANPSGNINRIDTSTLHVSDFANTVLDISYDTGTTS